ncbi:GGDEF domain-containing protein [Pantoea dispersa]|uniref:GGDEF domain-containing protein n=1 Tax=Pantoea dispersa TaxID=59814 RepID=UPI0024AF47A0|nr:GGDEF domain-containing protein [Pantoea dispersa]MDI6636460.1 GGDEF domain-containing protein [Pantoea dispersa]
MKSGIHNKLIREFESPKGMIYKMIKFFTSVMVGLIILLAFAMGDFSHVNAYLFINIFTILVMLWFVRESFNIHSIDDSLTIFRVSLFLLLNSSLASMAGGVGIISRDIASMCSAIIYAPSMIMIIYSFKNFISYANKTYNDAVILTLTDELTGLPNRRHLVSKLHELDKRQGTVCIADIDFFKKINDTYGHDIGDKVLKQVGEKLIKFCKEDVFISRSGGEEFVIIIFDNINAESFIKHLKASISDELSGSVCITFSMGLAIKYRNQSSSYAMGAADNALYKAKKPGRNCIIRAS